MAPPPVPIQGMNDMASQQRALQSYMDSMFASVPHPSTSQVQNASTNLQGKDNMMQQSFNGTPASLTANLPDQQHMYHPGVPTIFQPGANANANNSSSYTAMMPFAAQQSMPPPPQQQQNSQPQQQQAAPNSAWANHQQQNTNSKAGPGNRPMFTPQQQNQQALPPQLPQTQLANQMQQYSQAELQAMLASLGPAPQSQQQQQQPSMQQQNFQLPQQTQQQRPTYLPNFPQPPSMSSSNQQHNPQAFQTQPQAPPLPIQSSNANSQYPAHLQAAFQQLQAAHASHSTPPPGAIQALAAFQQQQQQHQQQHNQSAAMAAVQQAQQAVAAQQLQQQVQQAQAQLQAPQSNGSVPGLATPGTTPDISLLLKLRQQGVQLSADQQMLLSRTMPRRGAVTGDGTPVQNNTAQLPNQGQNQQVPNQQQQLLQGQQNMFQSPQMGNQSQLQQLAQPQNQQQQRLQQPPSQQNQQPMQLGNALSLDIPNMQPVNAQDQQARSLNNDGSIPLSVLQEFSQMNDHLRQMTAQEGHLQACLAQNLYLPYNKPGQPQGGNQPTPQPLTPQHREHFQKQMEQLRRIHSQVKENLAKIEENWGGKDNIISNLRNVAFQRQLQTGNNNGSNGNMQNEPLQQQQPAQMQQNQPQQPMQQQQMQQSFQSNQQAMQIPYQAPQQNQPQQSQQQQSQEAAQLQKLLNRQQMRTPVNTLQQQGLPQSTPPQAQAPALPQAQTQQVPPHMQQQPQQVQQQGYPVPQNAAAAQAQAQLQRVVQMQQNQMANGPHGSPGSNLKALPSIMPHQTQPHLSPSFEKASLQSQQQSGQRSHPEAPHGQNNAQQQQLLRMQAAAVNDEILKTLTNAGPQTFMKALIDTMKHRGTPLTTFPKVDGKEVDLFRLYRVVQQRGGSALIRQQGLWRQVALETGIPVSAESSQRVFDQMSKVYGDFLEAFEDTQRRAAFATVSKHSLSQMPVKMEKMPAKMEQTHVQQPQTQQPPQSQAPQSNQQALQQQPQQNNLQNQQFQQQQYMQNMQHIQAQVQAQVLLQNTNTPQQGQQQLPAHQQQQSQPGRGSQQMQAIHINEAPQQGQQQQNQQGQGQQRQISPPSLQQQGSQNLQNRLPNLPPPAEVTKARADIEAWKAALQQSKLKCTRLEDFNPADVEPFVNLATNLSPMVDRIIELLPLYLAISKSQQGAHNLLIMLFMFREQLALLDRREFILRVNDLEKLKMQMQRCWSYVSAYTSGTQTNSQSLPNTEIPSNVSNIPAPATTGYPSQQRSQNQTAPASTPEFVGATMKAGLTVQDLRPPPIKKRRTDSPSGTPPAAAAQPQSKATSSAQDQNGALGTGTYASPIALDSPPTKKALPVLEGQGQPMAAKPKATKRGAPQAKSSTQSTAPASPNKTAKPKTKKATAAAAAAQQTSPEDIRVPEVSMTITPAATPVVVQQEAQIPPQQQEETLKRKRELEDAQSDPAGFTERMFSSLLFSGQNNKQESDQSTTTGIFSSELLAFLNEEAFGEPASVTFAEPAPPVACETKQAKSQTRGLNLIFAEPTDGQALQPPTVGRWFQDTPSVTAETPELSHADDPTKTSPSDQNSVVTPSDALSATSNISVPEHLHHSSSTSTSSILSTFDREYEEFFKAATGASGTTTQAGNSPVGLGWSWEAGPVPVA